MTDKEKKEILKLYATAKTIDLVDKPEWLEALLGKSKREDFVLMVANKHIYGARSAWFREMAIRTRRVKAIWQTWSGAGIYIGASETNKVAFVFDDDLAEYQRKGNWPNSLDEAYTRDLEELDPSDRLDYEFYHPRYDVKEGGIWHPMTYYTKGISYGYHANPKRDGPFRIKETRERTMKFLSMSNISPHGYIIGSLEEKDVHMLPDTSKVSAGDVVFSLFGGNMQKRSIGSIGKAALVEDEYAPCFINQTMVSFKVNKSFDAHYILLALRSENFRTQLFRRMRPASKVQAIVTIEDFRKCRIKKIPESEMRALGRRYKKLMEAFRDEQKLIDKVNAL